MPTIEITDHYRHNGGTYTFDVSFIKKRDFDDRYNIRLNVPGLKGGRVLGWLVKGDRRGTWEVRVSSEAFRGADATDRGDSLDKVPTSLTRSETDGAGHRAIAYGCGTQWEAAYMLLAYLIRERSPIVPGFGPHHDVVTWASRWPNSVMS